MPSSLRRFNLRALEYSSRIPVSVCGTGTHSLHYSFSWKFFPHCVRGRSLGLQYLQHFGWIHHSVTIMVKRLGWCRNINLLCIDYSLRPRLSSRLTLSGRTLLRKPYPFGGPDFNRAYRYSSLDSHFLKVHRSSRFDFALAGTLFYRFLRSPQFRCIT